MGPQLAHLSDGCVHLSDGWPGATSEGAQPLPWKQQPCGIRKQSRAATVNGQVRSPVQSGNSPPQASWSRGGGGHEGVGWPALIAGHRASLRLRVIDTLRCPSPAARMSGAPQPTPRTPRLSRPSVCCARISPASSWPATCACAPTPPMVTAVSSHLPPLPPVLPLRWGCANARAVPPNPSVCPAGLLSENGSFQAEESRQRLAEVALAYAKAGE